MQEHIEKGRWLVNRLSLRKQHAGNRLLGYTMSRLKLPQIKMWGASE